MTTDWLTKWLNDWLHQHPAEGVINIETQDADSFVQWMGLQSFRQTHHTKEFQAITLYKKNFRQSYYTKRISGNPIIRKNFRQSHSTKESASWVSAAISKQIQWKREMGTFTHLKPFCPCSVAPTMLSQMFATCDATTHVTVPFISVCNVAHQQKLSQKAQHKHIMQFVMEKQKLFVGHKKRCNSICTMLIACPTRAREDGCKQKLFAGHKKRHKSVCTMLNACPRARDDGCKHFPLLVRKEGTRADVPCWMHAQQEHEKIDANRNHLWVTKEGTRVYVPCWMQVQLEKVDANRTCCWEKSKRVQERVYVPCGLWVQQEQGRWMQTGQQACLWHSPHLRYPEAQLTELSPSTCPHTQQKPK